MSVEPFQSMGDCVTGAPITAACNVFLQTQQNSIAGDAVQFKNQTFANVYNNAVSDFNTTRQTAGTLKITEDAVRQAASEENTNSKIKNMYTHDIDLSKRQFQINEYHYNNKLEFLFFLQLLFISVLVMAILVYMNRNGMLTTSATAVATMALSLIVVAVGVSRYFYTRQTRDRNLWNRRYFGSETAPDTSLFPATCPGPTSALTINMDAIVDPRTTQCAMETSDAIDQWKIAAKNEVESALNGTDASSLWAASLSMGPSSSCKAK